MRVAAGVVLAYLMVIGAELYFGKDMQRGSFTRLLSDDYDKRIYHQRGMFLPAGKTPYKDVFSEYPTVATLSFAAPFVVTRDAVANYAVYSFVWSALMGVCLLLTVHRVASCRARRGSSPWPALILLSPGVIYFSLMRFDVLVALMMCLSLDAFLRGRYGWAHALLGIGTFTKWYPALAFPVYLARHREQALEGKGPGLVRPSLYFMGTVAFIGLASIAAFTWDGFLVPYKFHSQRGGQYFNVYWVLESVFRERSLLESPAWKWIGMLFFGLQFSIAPIVLFRRPQSAEEAVRFTVLGVFLFMVFAKIDSPQWILWYLPPALMVARSRVLIILAAVVSVLNYLVFPVVYDAAGWNTWPYDLVVIARAIASVTFIVLLLREKSARSP